MPMVQLADGDVIFVLPHAKRVKIDGLVANAKRFEFQGQGQTVAQLMQLAKPCLTLPMCALYATPAACAMLSITPWE